MKWLKGFWIGLLCLLMLAAGMPAVLAEEEMPETGIPTYELMRFSEFERPVGAAHDSLLYGDTLYANWTTADGLEELPGIDLETAYPGRENLRLKVTIQMSSTEPTVDLEDCWQSFVVKLRSPDVENKEGDPTLEHDPDNREHNYGWEVRPADVESVDGKFSISIPLDRPADHSRGLMDWTAVQRIILTMRLKDSLIADGLADTMTMTLSDVRVVNDIMQITRDDITGVIDAAFPAGVNYHPDSITAFEQVREEALALMVEETTSLAALQEMAAKVKQVRESMVETTYDVADFSRLCGEYPDRVTNTLFADWAYVRQGGDGVGVNLLPHDRSRLHLQLEFTLTGPADYDGVWNTDGWVLLRSAETDKTATFGFGLSAADAAIGPMQTGVNRLSIPLDATAEEGYTLLQSDDNATGTTGRFDWGNLNRIQLYLAPEGYEKGEFSLTVTMARVVDVTQPEQVLPALDAALTPPEQEAAAYTAASWQVYETARQAAVDVRNNWVYATTEDLATAATALQEAAGQLELRPPYKPGDIDDDGAVTTTDALMALQKTTGKITLSETATLAADVDGNGAITVSDALLILQVVTGKATLPENV